MNIYAKCYFYKILIRLKERILEKESERFTFSTFGISKNNLFSHSVILSKLAMRRPKKLLPCDSINVRFGRSTKQIISNDFDVTSHHQ